MSPLQRLEHDTRTKRMRWVQARRKGSPRAARRAWYLFLDAYFRWQDARGAR